VEKVTGADRNAADTTKQPEGLAEARRTFEHAGLPLPPVPERFASALRKTAEWCFSTREIEPMRMYMFDRCLYDALAEQSQDYLAFCHAGHGVNSYALNYHLIDGPLVLVVQAPYGGVYMTDEDTRKAIEQLQRCGALIDAVERAKARGLSAHPGRLCVFESTLRGLFAWGWLKQSLADEDQATSWIEQHRVGNADLLGNSLSSHQLPTAAAVAWLDEQTFREPPHHRR